jgi:hypothetical protein
MINVLGYFEKCVVWRAYALRSCSVEIVSAGICFALMLPEGRHFGHMLGVHAPWRSSRLESV